MTRQYCLGLDLGKKTDYTALAALSWDWPPSAPPVYEMPLLKRWPLETPYLEIVADVAAIHQTKPLSQSGRKPLLVVDATGVGDAVYEMVLAEMTAAKLHGSCCAVTITAGSAVTLAGPGRWRVAKKQLVSVLQVLLGKRRLQIAQALPEAKTLRAELGTFSAKITEAANETYESWRERDHDDLVLAVALAAWAAEKLYVFQPPRPRPQGPERPRVII